MTRYLHDAIGLRGPHPRGQVAIWSQDEQTGLVLPCSRQPKPNQIQDTWGFVAAQALLGKREYRLGGMYLEFENVADPDDEVTVPTFSSADGIEYYSDLVFSGNRDFLRVALRQDPLLEIETGYEELFVAGVSGNKLTVSAMSEGVVGIHGKTYSDSVNSKVFGVALVATPVFADRTQDVIFARTYFDAAQQTVKEPSRQIGITWSISFLGSV